MSLKKHFALYLFFTAVCATQIHGQGCVAIRGGSSCHGIAGINPLSLADQDIELQLNYRYFRSFRHFRGSHEETHRLDEGTEVINKSHFVDLGIAYGITDRLMAQASIPLVFHYRSSMYEHGGNPPNGLGDRNSTNSSGLSDIRLGLNYIITPAHQSFLNLSIGAGVKLPTGSYDYTDTFYNQGENKDQNIEKVVDQSIMPGDGGTGVYLQMQAIADLSTSIQLSASGFYMANPRATNGVLTRNGNSVYSCPDQFSFRLGASALFNKGFALYLGGLYEGVPSSDLIGSSEGYRRPGFAVSVDPGIAYGIGPFSLFLNVPFAVYRNRVQSFEDKERTLQTGVYRHGDAAFADYLINFGVRYRIQKIKHTPMVDTAPIPID